jgi:hypothetical protein
VEKFVEILDEMAALKMRILLLAPHEHRKALCAYTLQETANLVENVLKANGGGPIELK